MRILGALLALVTAVFVVYETNSVLGDYSEAEPAWGVATGLFAALGVATLLTLAMIGFRRRPTPRTVLALLLTSAPVLLLLWFVAGLFLSSGGAG